MQYKPKYKPILCIVAVFMMLTSTASLLTLLHATDLPIDIEAIRRQPVIDIQLPGQFRTNLFTDDSRVATDAVEAQNRRRQGTSSYLFQETVVISPVSPQYRLTQAVENTTLFSSPTDFSHVRMPQAEDEFPTWLIVIIIITASVAGFALALAMRSKKKTEAGDVH